MIPVLLHMLKSGVSLLSMDFKLRNEWMNIQTPICDNHPIINQYKYDHKYDHQP